MIKAAFFDIDGTLLSFTTHRVSPGTVRAFDRLHRAGVRTFLSTGRPDVLIPEMPVSFEAKITMNGGLVFVGDHLGANGGQKKPTQTLLSNPIPDAELQAWLDLAKNKHLCTMVFTEDNMFLTQPNEVGLKLRNQLEFEMPRLRPNADLMDEDIYQFIAMIPESMDAEVLAMLPHSRLPRWHPAFSDLVPADSSKAVGMEKVLSHLGMRREESIAFGDGGNDIEMLDYAGIGVAMGNASDNVKAHADHVTSDVDHEGILTALETLNVI